MVGLQRLFLTRSAIKHYLPTKYINKQQQRARIPLSRLPNSLLTDQNLTSQKHKNNNTMSPSDTQNFPEGNQQSTELQGWPTNFRSSSRSEVRRLLYALIENYPNLPNLDPFPEKIKKLIENIDLHGTHLFSLYSDYNQKIMAFGLFQDGLDIELAKLISREAWKKMKDASQQYGQMNISNLPQLVLLTAC